MLSTKVEHVASEASAVGVEGAEGELEATKQRWKNGMILDWSSSLYS